MSIRYLVAAATTSLLVLGACSSPDQAEKTVSDKNATTVRKEAARKKQVAANLAGLPARPSGRIDLAGSTTRTITTAAARDYSTSGATNEVKVSSPGVDQAFAGLCSGQVDLVDSGRQITKKELATCQSNGLDVVQFQVASDAIVLAAKAESDVGGDCVDLTQVKTMYRAGSPITSWRQLKFADVPLTVAGPVATGDGFSLFGQLALGRDVPVLSDLRSDYLAGATQLDTLTAVIGTKDDNEQAAYLSSRKLAVTSLRRELSTARATLNAARAEVKAAQSDRQKGITDGRSVAQQAKDQTRQDAAYPVRDKALRAYNRLKVKVKDAEAAATRSAEASRQLASRAGRAGIFQFSYYEAEQEQLRAFEITRDGAKDCIFPSQRTIAEGQYPLSVPLLITTTTRSLDRAEVKDFMTVLVDGVDKRAKDSSLIPPTADILSTERAWATGEAKPTLVSFDNHSTSADATPGPA